MAVEIQWTQANGEGVFVVTERVDSIAEAVSLRGTGTIVVRDQG
jgi:hypothetical protein